MASAFIIVVHSEFQPDPNEETTALLRIVIHTLNNTAFGDQVPTVPQWTGPPRRIVQVQAILVASLFTSLLSAFLAMLGKQWLNRCTPVDTRGTIIQRSQHRQRKFDGIRNWYFDHVMEALPLMLQAALLLLGCALSRYLWEIDTTVASVVLGFTAFGVLFYLFIVIAGVVSENCPYQTPAANFIRHIPTAISHTPVLLHRSIQSALHFIRAVFRCVLYVFRHIRGALLRVLYVFRHIPQRVPHIFRHIRGTLQRVPRIFRHSPRTLHVPHSGRSGHSRAPRNLLTFDCLVLICNTFQALRDPESRLYAVVMFLLAIFMLPIALILDSCMVIMDLLACFILLPFIFIQLVSQVRLELHTEQTTEQQIVGHDLDLHCVLWTLQTSVDGPIRQSALEYLSTMTLNNINPTQSIASWFDIFLKCVQVTNGNVTIIQGAELLAEKSSLFCLHMLSDVVAAYPTPRKVLEDVRQQFTRTFPSKTNFGDLPVSHTLSAIRTVFCSNRTEGLWNIFLAEGPMRSLAPRAAQRRVQWDNYQPSGSDHAIVARALVKFARFEYRGSGERAKVPRWLLRFALHSLSQDPLPPPTIISDSLSIVAIDLGCYVPNGAIVEPLDQR